MPIYFRGTREQVPPLGGPLYRFIPSALSRFWSRKHYFLPFLFNRLLISINETEEMFISSIFLKNINNLVFFPTIAIPEAAI